MIAALLVAAAPASAQTGAQQPAPSDTSAIILAPKPAAPGAAQVQPPPAQGVSSGLSANMTASMPKYQPKPAHPSPSPDLRDIDKPKNEIPRLPVAVMSRYLVKGDKVPVFREQDIYTTSGLIDLSFKRHPGLRIGNIFNLNAGIAYEMIKDDERLGAIDDLKDTAYAMAVGGDPAEAKAILDATGEVFIRDEDNSGPVGIK